MKGSGRCEIVTNPGWDSRIWSVVRVVSKQDVRANEVADVSF